MRNFIYQNSCKVIFGKDSHRKAGKELSEFGSRALLVYGGGSIKRSGLYDTLCDDLAAAGMTVFELGGVQPNPRLDKAREGAALCKQEKIDCVLAVGGGSVIDTAKAVGAGALMDEDIWCCYEKKRRISACLPVGVVLTIPASGSECSPVSVLTRPDERQKRDAVSLSMVPRFVILNPELTMTLPAYQTACGVSDMLAHLMERYFSPTGQTELTDGLLESAMRTVLDIGPQVLSQPHDYNLRAQLMLAGTLAHNGFLDLGRLGDWGVHGIEHELSGFYDVSHGAGLAMLYPAWLRQAERAGLPRLNEFARRVMGQNSPGEAADALEDFYRRMGLPVRLTQGGIDESRLEEMAESALQASPGGVGTFLTLDKAGVLAILRSAL